MFVLPWYRNVTHCSGGTCITHGTLGEQRKDARGLLPGHKRITGIRYVCSSVIHMDMNGRRLVRTKRDHHCREEEAAHPAGDLLP